MDIQFSPHNTHHISIKAFHEQDPHLQNCQAQPFTFHSPLLQQIPQQIPGIYTIGGGRQIGKTTLLKQWMAQLLQQGVPAQSIYFITGELIHDQYTLLKIIQEALATMPTDHQQYLIIDEITYIEDWDRAIKYAADAGFFNNTAVILTGSDLALLQQARMTFPGRRGKADQTDFHLYPLSFKEFVDLTHDTHYATLTQKEYTENSKHIDTFSTAFKHYLIHGGYLTAINDFAKDQHILPATFRTYADWIRGDVVKRHKQEHYLKEILSAIIKRYGSQLTYNSLVKDLSIDHPKTVADYIHLLETMDAVFVQHALLEDKLVAAPKKAKKCLFTDPFVFHAIRSWIFSTLKPFQEQVLTALEDPQLLSQLVESCVVTHFRRYYPTYYIKAAGEVDIAYIKDENFWPVEIKWTEQLRPKDLKQIQKYPHATIYTKHNHHHDIFGIPTVHLPWALYQLCVRNKIF